MEGDIFEKADFEADGHDLAKIRRRSEVFSTGTEIGEGEVTCPREFEAGGYDGGVEVEDGAKLNFETKLHRAGRERPATKNPASTVGQRRGKVWEEAVALFVTEALDIERLHFVDEVTAAGNFCR